MEFKQSKKETSRRLREEKNATQRSYALEGTMREALQRGDKQLAEDSRMDLLINLNFLMGWMASKEKYKLAAAYKKKIEALKQEVF